MTKAEKQQLDNITSERKLFNAMRIYDPVEPDLLPPKSGEPCTMGWIFNTHSAEIIFCASSVTSHCSSWNEESVRSWAQAHSTGGKWQGGGSQGAVRLYSTKTLACRALLAEVSRSQAKILAKIVDLLREAEAQENL